MADSDYESEDLSDGGDFHDDDSDVADADAGRSRKPSIPIVAAAPSVNPNFSSNILEQYAILLAYVT